MQSNIGSYSSFESIAHTKLSYRKLIEIDKTLFNNHICIQMIETPYNGVKLQVSKAITRSFSANESN